MFGSTNPFGQSSSSPFGSQSVFGQTNNASNNPFAPKPFGSTTPFGSQSGGSIFGGTTTGVFGATQASPALSSTPVFGASSSPAFGSTMPTFGASSTSAFGSSSSSSFGGSSLFGQKPAFGGFGSSTTQTSPFGNTFQQSQPTFGSSPFGSSTPFGASSQSAFSAPTMQAFGSSSTAAFGATNTPAFGATSTPAFGSAASPTFGSTVNAFGVSSSPVFGSSSPAFGATSAPAFGATSAPAFGASSTPAFGASSTLAFGTSTNPAFGTSTPSFSFGSTQAFGQSSSAFGNSPFGNSPSPFGAQSSSFGAQATTPTFGSPSFGPSAVGGRGGSRVAAYTPTAEVDSGSGTQPAGKLESISAMPVYKDKSHEELRWEDYQLGDKGGPSPAGPTAALIGYGASNTQSNPFGSSSMFGQTSANPFSSTTAPNPFAPKTPAFGTSGFGSSSLPAFGSSGFGALSPANPFGSTSSATPSIFGSSTPAFGASTSASLFGSPGSSSAFGSSTPFFGSASAQGTTSTFTSGLNFGTTQSSPFFQSTGPSLGQSTPAFGQTPSSFGQSTSAFGQSSLFSTPSTGFGGNIFSSTPSLLTTSNTMGFGQTMPSLSAPFQQAQPSQNTGVFGIGNFGQTQAAGLSGFGSTPGIFGQSNFGQSSAAQNTAAVQPALVSNPFGNLPAMPLISIGHVGTSPSIQYGISSMPVVDKPAPVRISSLLTARHLSQRRTRLPARKYHPNDDGPMVKVPFFIDNQETPSTPKADAAFIPRENPRALVIRPLEQWTRRANGETRYPSKDVTQAHENDVVENGLIKERGNPVKLSQKTNGGHDHSNQKGDSYITLTGHRAGEAAIVYEHGADIEALMPKLRHSDYYTEPRIQELAAKERAEPGFCRRIKYFVVGRHGYGSIKFLGETDVRRLDLESLIQFNHREVIVYMDESKKPPVGQGLNKPAVVTLLNVKCFDKKTGCHYTEGPRIDKYKEMLRRKAEDQGADFVSYDPIKGEWKFKVNHFSEYSVGDEDEVKDD